MRILRTCVFRVFVYVCVVLVVVVVSLGSEKQRERESDYFCQLRRTISGRERDRGVDQAMRERFENV